MRSTIGKYRALLLAGALLTQSATALAQSAAKDRTYQDPDSLVRSLYAAVTFDRGGTPDWSYVRSLFHKDASIVLRVTRDSTAIMTVEGFLKDFIDFIDRFRADTTGFRERVLRIKPMVLGNIAHMLVLYDASVPTSPRPPQQGVDSFHLVRNQGRWWITSIVNEVLTRDRPRPELLRE